MNNVERHQHILKQIKQEGHITVLDLCKKLNVSSVTIRKDLQFLEDSGLVYRTHGGATSQNPYQTDRTVFEKEKIHETEKLAIARAASKLVINNDSIIIGSGTTTQFFARELAPHHNLTVVTSALNVTLELIKHDSVEVIQLGGAVRKTSTSVTGHYAHGTLDHFFCSKLFLGVDGIDIDFGISTTNAQEAMLNMKMIDAAQQVIVLADSSKFGRKSFGKIVDFSRIDMVISDSIPPKFKEMFDSLGIETVICSEA